MRTQIRFCSCCNNISDSETCPICVSQKRERSIVCVVEDTRDVMAIEHFSFVKKRLQRLGSWVVRQVSGTQVPDTTSGFRAYTRDAALRMTIVSEFSYTLESIIQAGKKRMAEINQRLAALL